MRTAFENLGYGYVKVNLFIYLFIFRSGLYGSDAFVLLLLFTVNVANFDWLRNGK